MFKKPSNAETHSSLSTLYSNKQVTFEHLRSRTKNEAMLQALDEAEAWSCIDDPVLLLGETGCGKNMVAQAIHNSKGRDGQFYEINCAGIPETLFESEVFGTMKGAFTGSIDRAGKVEAAKGGTLFLDEISELTLLLQSKLLSFIEQKKFARVGSTMVQAADVYIVCATNKSLVELQDPAHFRQDFFYRLAQCVPIPSLRERKDDIPSLIHLFAESYQKKIGLQDIVVESDVTPWLQEYQWPGNIRQLKHAVERGIHRAVIEAKKQAAQKSAKADWIKMAAHEIGQISLKIAHIPKEICYDEANFGTRLEEKEGSDMSLAVAVKRHILQVWKTQDKNCTKAAKQLAIGRQTLYRKLAEYGESSDD